MMTSCSSPNLTSVVFLVWFLGGILAAAATAWVHATIQADYHRQMALGDQGAPPRLWWRIAAPVGTLLLTFGVAVAIGWVTYSAQWADYRRCLP